MNRKISVVTVTWNAASMLLSTLESVASQTYDDIEYIVVDGASSDNTVEVLENSQNVTNWISEPDRGIYDAMNKGALMATGEWILFLNAGDRFASPDVVEKLMNGLKSCPDADVVYGDVIRSSEAEGLHEEKVASDCFKNHRLPFCHQSVMCRRSLLLKHPFDISHRYSSDFKFFKILNKEGRKFVHLHFPVALFDVSGISTRNRSAGIADNMKVIKEVDGLTCGLPAILHLLPTYLLCRLRGK